MSNYILHTTTVYKVHKILSVNITYILLVILSRVTFNNFKVKSLNVMRPTHGLPHTDYDSDGPEMEDVRRIIQPLALDSYLSSLNSSSHQ